MTSIQDIHALETQIYDAVDEYLTNREGYDHPVLHVYFDNEQMKHVAEMEDNLLGSEDDGIYPIRSLIRKGPDGFEPDNDRISDIANSWIFLD